MTEQAFTEEEASAFSAKLDAWGQTLSDREQAILRGLLANAINGTPTASDDADVSGFAFDAFHKESAPTPSLLGGFSTRDLSQTALAPMTGTPLQIKWG
jgi:hypothetical protein